MTNSDIINGIKNYLDNKKFDFKIKCIGENNILFTYNYLNINFIIDIFLVLKDKEIFIKYLSNTEVLNINRLRNSSNNKNYCRNVYNNLNYIKSELNRYASIKNTLDNNRNKYCLELESYYKKIHSNISIMVEKSEFSDTIDIIIIGKDRNKTTYYNISYINNKYFLDSKRETFLIKY